MNLDGMNTNRMKGKHEELLVMLGEGLSTREVAKRIGVSQTTVRYWLKKWRLSTQPVSKARREREVRDCRLCGKPLKTIRHDRRRLAHKCETCFAKLRKYRIKKAAVAYKGEKCQRCGWSGCPAGFDFHHRDPSSKKFGIGVSYRRSRKKIKAELDKCDLLCAICHRVEHFVEPDEAFLAEASTTVITFDDLP